MSNEVLADRSMAERYAAAWCSGHPDQVVQFYAPDGQFSTNGGPTGTGHDAVRGMVTGFLSDFPDLKVRCEDFRHGGRHAVFIWTLEGHHSETNNYCRVSGWEEWDLDDNGLFVETRGRFDPVEYARQVQEGV